MSQLQFEQTFMPGEIRVVCTSSSVAYQFYSGTNKNYKFVQTAIVQAHPSNVGNLFIGDSGVSSNSLVLTPGQSVSLGWMMDLKASAVLDLSKFYVMSASAGDSLHILAPIRVRGLD